jgi:DNA-binding FadR family transcriptional regulator
LPTGSDDATANRHTRVLRALGEWITTGMREGAVKSIDEVATEYGVSRAIAREVCQVLQAKGLVTIRQRIGIRVRPQHEWMLYDPQVIMWRLDVDYESQIRSLTELRAAVEPLGVELAAQRATSQQRGQLRGLAEQLRILGTRREGLERADFAAFLDVDQRYHRLVIASSGNEMFQGLGVPFDQVLHARMHRTGKFPAWPQPLALHLHVAVAEAINQRHAAAARICMTAILAEVGGKLSGDLISKVKRACAEIGLDTDDNAKVLNDALLVPGGSGEG